jgi:hypothetical protein
MRCGATDSVNVARMLRHRSPRKRVWTRWLTFGPEGWSSCLLAQLRDLGCLVRPWPATRWHPWWAGGGRHVRFAISGGISHLFTFCSRHGQIKETPTVGSVESVIHANRVAWADFSGLMALPDVDRSKATNWCFVFGARLQWSSWGWLPQGGAFRSGLDRFLLRRADVDVMFHDCVYFAPVRRGSGWLCGRR